MQLADRVNTERVCPGCGGQSQIPYADEQIDSEKINEFTYASRKQPEFMCLRLVRCRECDLVYAPSPPPVEFLSNAYSDADFDSGPEALAAAKNYSKVLTPHIARLAGRNAAVDVGAGTGPLLPWLRECGFDPVIGIEPSRAAINAASPEVRAMLREGMFSPNLLADISPSLLCSFMTLEHLPDPGEFLRTAFDLMEPGGMLAIVVHNWRAPLNRLLGLRSPIIDVEHLQLFSPRSLKALLEKTGFTSVNMESIENTYPLGYWFRLTPLPTGIKNPIEAVLKFTGLSNIHVSLKVGNMLAVATKPERINNG